MQSPPPRDPDLVWSDDGSPRSGRFGDVYFSAEDGLAETRAVFLAGCGLPQAWAGREQFTVGELGFGTGLNVLALLDLWRRERPAGGRLSIFSIEGFPIRREEAERAHARWPELAEVAAPLLARWPARTPGFHRVDLPELSATLDLAVMDVAEALAAWSGPADAWFLDGFAPSTNPEMWREEVLALVAARSAPGARAATFTVAGTVRRGLQAQGFEIAKRPGYGRKRERLEASFAGTPAAVAGAGRVVVVGGGIAGASLVRAFGTLGVTPTLVDAGGPAAPLGASGNPAALVTPRFDAGGGPIAAFYAQAFERAVQLYAGDAVIARGVVQLEQTDRDPARFDRIADQALWPEGALERLTPEAASARFGEPVARGGLLIRDALTVEPAEVVRAWTADTPRITAEVAGLKQVDGVWRLLDAEGRLIAEAETVCLAGGWAGAHLVDAPLSPVRGQVTCAEGVRLGSAVAWGGYAAPTRRGVLFGATHDRGQAETSAATADNKRNLETLSRVLPGLAQACTAAPLSGRAAVRAVTPDRLPLCGPLGEALYVLGGLGSRGFVAAPLLAEHVAALACGAPSPLPAELAARMQASRFASTAKLEDL